jgi:hypothetical protein
MVTMVTEKRVINWREAEAEFGFPTPLKSGILKKGVIISASRSCSINIAANAA